MRISLVAPLFAPMREPQPFGPHAVLVDLARELSRRGHAVTLHAAAGSAVPGVQIAPIETEAAVSRARVLPASGGREGQDGPVRRAFERLYRDVRRRRPDAISQHAFDAEAIELGEGLPILHTLHLAPIVPAVVEAARATEARTATVSRTAAASWTRAGLASVEILPNGVPDVVVGRVDDVHPAALIAGRISPEKGTAVAIRAAQSAGLTPVVVGEPYDDAYFAESVRPLLGRAELRPTMSRPQLSHLMARSAVLVMPSSGFETFGLVAAEAQMAGCPVVAWADGALPEVIEDGVSGRLVRVGDEAGLVTAIGEVRRYDRGKVRRSAGARLGLAPAVDRYERVLSEVAGRP